MRNKDLKKQILDISYKNKLSHIGSCLTAVDIIDDIYQSKKYDEKFVLSSGHAALALYVVLQKYNNPDYGKSAEEMYLDHGVHPEACSECNIDCSTGSLGQGLPIAVGMALADRTKNVYCLISDGECAEGSIWEALAIKDKLSLNNLKVFVNYNGWAAYDYVDSYMLANRLIQWGIHKSNIIRTDVDMFPFLQELKGHYHVMSEKDYKQGLEIINA